MERSDSEAISERERAIVEEEERLLSIVRSAVESADPQSSRERVRRQMTTLRTDLGEATAGDLAAIAAEAQRVRSAGRIQQHAKQVDLELPYFAHMQLESDRGVRDVLLGQCTLIDAKRNVAIVDWREAPIAQVFFHYAEGEDYEQEFPDRSVEGVLRKRRILAFDRGELVHIQTPDSSLRRGPDGQWRCDRRGRRPRFEGGEGGTLAKRIIGTGLSGESCP